MNTFPHSHHAHNTQQPTNNSGHGYNHYTSINTKQEVDSIVFNSTLSLSNWVG